MYKPFSVALIAALTAFTALAAATPASALTGTGPKKRVGIVSFVDKTGHPGVAEAAIDVLTTELVKTGKFIVVERAEIAEVLKEQAFGQSGAVNPNTAAQAGKILGLQGIVIGSVSNFGRKKTTSVYPFVDKGKNASIVTVDIRVIDAETAQVLLAESGTGAVEISETHVLGFGPHTKYDETIDGNAFRAAVTQFMTNLLNQLDQGEWTGRVVKVSEGTAIINAGEATGLKLGDELAAFETGEELIDPDTGMSLGMEEGAMKGLCRIVKFFGKNNDVSQCKISLGNLQKLDIVRLKQ